MRPSWDQLTREEKALEIAGMAWVAFVFLGAPVLWLILWLIG